MESLIEVLEAMAAQGFVIDTPQGTYRFRLDLDEGEAEQEQPTQDQMSW